MPEMTGCDHGGVPEPTLLTAWLDQPGRATISAVGPDEVTTSPPGATADAGALPPPGVEAVLDALAAPRPEPEDVSHALTVFAWERAAQAADLTCVLAEVDELWEVLEDTGGAPLSPGTVRHRLVNAWVDAVAAERGSPGVDPLSGLHTIGYLYGRVQELDRLDGIEPMPLVLIVMRWDAAAGPWMRIARIMQAASALRSRVRPEATLSQVGTTMAIALVPDDARARVERISLTKAVENGELSTAHVLVDVFAVPDTRARLPELVTRLHGGANVDHAVRPPSFRHSGTGSLD